MEVSKTKIAGAFVAALVVVCLAVIGTVGYLKPAETENETLTAKSVKDAEASAESAATAAQSARRAADSTRATAESAQNSAGDASKSAHDAAKNVFDQTERQRDKR